MNSMISGFGVRIDHASSLAPKRIAARFLGRLPGDGFTLRLESPGGGR
jgi:hypothetical protein